MCDFCLVRPYLQFTARPDWTYQGRFELEISKAQFETFMHKYIHTQLSATHHNGSLRVINCVSL